MNYPWSKIAATRALKEIAMEDIDLNEKAIDRWISQQTVKQMVNNTLALELQREVGSTRKALKSYPQARLHPDPFNQHIDPGRPSADAWWQWVV